MKKTLLFAALCALLLVTVALAETVPVTPLPGATIITPVGGGTATIVQVAPDGNSLTIPSWYGIPPLGISFTLQQDFYFVKDGWWDPLNLEFVKIVVVFTDSNGDGEADGCTIGTIYGNPPNTSHPLSGATNYTAARP